MGRCAKPPRGPSSATPWPWPHGRGPAALRRLRSQRPFASFLCPVTGASPLAGVMCAATMCRRLVLPTTFAAYPTAHDDGRQSPGLARRSPECHGLPHGAGWLPLGHGQDGPAVAPQAHDIQRLQKNYPGTTICRGKSNLTYYRLCTKRTFSAVSFSRGFLTFLHQCERRASRHDLILSHNHIYVNV